MSAVSGVVISLDPRVGLGVGSVKVLSLVLTPGLVLVSAVSRCCH